eukprot:gnl/TRDRNA2_/TRDRNA2_163237_c0_seq2.p1 gnl/TRDRNA2_/TRDRNA2_163237_c0~~gnl/TRDRNA2_/TRDRNA2_163237_c0_seq2.p1  ORF type:complete len:330 (-),score=24.48 gnl/TRDRNA2_/TRDRNA2_163237_c0_seq2:89-979(-)
MALLDIVVLFAVICAVCVRGAGESDCGEGKGELEYGGLTRRYLVYRPCRELPTRAIMFTVHCFGCTAVHQFKGYLPLAREHGILLVAPDGYQNSFNGVHCCGPALARGLDDVGFVRAVVEKEDGGRGLPVLGNGHSNGGFLSSAIAKTYPGWLSALAVSSGHVYEGLQSLGRTAVLILWDRGDGHVRYDGCCRDPDAVACCCGISGKGPATCVSAPDIFAAWRHGNGCRQDSTKSDSLGGTGTCEVASGCSHPTVLCTYTGHSHQSWASTPAHLARHVFDFFEARLKEAEGRNAEL